MKPCGVGKNATLYEHCADFQIVTPNTHIITVVGDSIHNKPSGSQSRGKKAVFREHFKEYSLADFRHLS